MGQCPAVGIGRQGVVLGSDHQGQDGEVLEGVGQWRRASWMADVLPAENATTGSSSMPRWSSSAANASACAAGDGFMGIGDPRNPDLDAEPICADRSEFNPPGRHLFSGAPATDPARSMVAVLREGRDALSHAGLSIS